MYDHMHQAIADRRLPPGTKLVEEGLAEIFEVSRARVRKVLQRLAHDKMVTLEPNRGAFVARPSAEDARQVFAARRVIEDAIVRAVASRVKSAEIDELKRLNQAEHQAHEGSDLHGAIRLSGDFHLQLAEYGGNPILAGFLRELVSRSSLIIALYQSPGGPDCAFDEHEKIIDALAVGDGETAAQEMRAHLSQIESRLNLTEPEAEPIALRDVFAKFAGAVAPSARKRH
jgi:DNA-binding GntR family transcriptional regulator